jgi:biopolymer transport protein ExbD
MKRASTRHQPRLITEMSVTPLLDLVFVLLFVFMVAAPLLKSQPEIDLAATAAQTQESSEGGAPEITVDLTVAADLTLSLAEKSVAEADLPIVISEILKGEPETGVIVRMDRKLAVEHLIRLMGILDAAGVKHTAVAAIAGEAAP